MPDGNRSVSSRLRKNHVACSSRQQGFAILLSQPTLATALQVEGSVALRDVIAWSISQQSRCAVNRIAWSLKLEKIANRSLIQLNFQSCQTGQAVGCSELLI